ncbi:hypothetical protein C1H46_008617 [Malus baccata]|uniref:Uncharacterized protein n=1 Tax=Malus baccata TaxID=106549 RepID=A0A540N416_MALBA|nr:hypothetical protein C1H46_008617 [Malus baccata]
MLKINPSHAHRTKPEINCIIHKQYPTDRVCSHQEKEASGKETPTGNSAKTDTQTKGGGVTTRAETLHIFLESRETQ